MEKFKIVQVRQRGPRWDWKWEVVAGHYYWNNHVVGLSWEFCTEEEANAAAAYFLDLTKGEPVDREAVRTAAQRARSGVGAREDA